jgi:RNA polymerase-interacting CarD/CdnL/TRCF family regulator
MNYEIGDTVVHWTHGLGTVIAIDEMQMAGISQQYYVIEVDLLKVWVPVQEANEGSIRLPTESLKFEALFEILRAPGGPLPEQQYQRKIELRDRMQKRTLEGLCHLIRDLIDRSRRRPLNPNDSTVLYRAEELLLDEWVLSLGVERSDAIQELEGLLREEPSELSGMVQEPTA